MYSQVQLFGQEEGSVVSRDEDNKIDDEMTQIDELKNILKDLVLDNATLRKQVNSVFRYSLKSDDSSEKSDEVGPPSISAQDTGVAR